MSRWGILILINTLLFSIYFFGGERKQKYIVKLTNSFLITAMLSGLMYTVFFPPFTMPDEHAHFYTSYALADRLQGKVVSLLIKDMDGVKGGSVVSFQVREADIVYKEYPDGQYKRDGYSIFKNFHFFTEETNDVYIETRNMTYSPFPTYFVDALGILIGKSINLSAEMLAYFIRMLNFTLYIILCVIALKIIPILKKTLYIFCSCPFMIQLGMSCTYDSLLLPVIILFISYILYLIYSKEQIRIKEIIIILCLVLILSPAKGAYFPIVFMILLLPRQKFSSNKSFYHAVIAILGVSTILWLGYNLLSNDLSDMISADAKKRVIEYSDSEGVYLTDIIRHPFRYFKIILLTFDRNFICLSGLFTTMRIGETNLVMYGFIFLFVSTIYMEENEVFFRMPKKNRFLIAGILILGYALLCMLTLISWGGKNAEIAPIKAAYILPYVPILAVFLKTDKIQIYCIPDKTLVVMNMVLQYIVMFNVGYAVGMF